MSDISLEARDAFAETVVTEAPDINGMAADLCARERALPDLHRRLGDIAVCDDLDEVLDGPTEEPVDPVAETNERPSFNPDDVVPPEAAAGSPPSDEPPINKPPTGGPKKGPDGEEPEGDGTDYDHKAKVAKANAFFATNDWTDKRRVIADALGLHELYRHADQEQAEPWPEAKTVADFRDKIREVATEGADEGVEEVRLDIAGELGAKFTAVYAGPSPEDPDMIAARLTVEVGIAPSDTSQPLVPLTKMEYVYVQEEGLAAVDRVIHTDRPDDDPPSVPSEYELEDLTVLLGEAARVAKEEQQEQAGSGSSGGPTIEDKSSTGGPEDGPGDEDTAYGHPAIDAKVDAFFKKPESERNDKSQLIADALMSHHRYSYVTEETLEAAFADPATMTDLRDKIRDVATGEGANEGVRRMRIGVGPDDLGLQLTATYAGPLSDDTIPLAVAELRVELGITPSDTSQPPTPIVELVYSYGQKDGAVTTKRKVFTNKFGRAPTPWVSKDELDNIGDLLDRAARITNEEQQGQASERTEDNREGTED